MSKSFCLHHFICFLSYHLLFSYLFLMSISLTSLLFLFSKCIPASVCVCNVQCIFIPIILSIISSILALLSTFPTHIFNHLLLWHVPGEFKKERQFIILFTLERYTRTRMPFSVKSQSSSLICFFFPLVSWCQLRKLLSVSREATCAQCLWSLHSLQIGIRVTNFWSVRKYCNQMRWDVGCILGGIEAQIYDIEPFQQSLLPYQVECFRDAKQFHLSGFLCVCCE